MLPARAHNVMIEKVKQFFGRVSDGCVINCSFAQAHARSTLVFYLATGNVDINSIDTRHRCYLVVVSNASRPSKNNSSSSSSSGSMELAI